MDYFQAVWLAVIQGISEFLPISSSAHLLFPSLIFGSNDLGLAFDISAHAGTLFAVMYYFRDEIKGMVKSLFQSNNLLKEDNLDFKLLIPLINQTILKLNDNKPGDVQTGPAKRKDVKLIKHQLEMISNKKTKDLYQFITNSIIELNE